VSAAEEKKPRASGPITVGRYVLHTEIAAGGMATVYMGRLAGPAGFSRVVAIKRMHDVFASNPEFVTMFLDEASLAARIQHPNVAATLDVVAKQREIFIVMDYVHGEALATLLRTARKRKERVPVGIACSILCGVLAGLHAAHTARDDSGEPLHIVHRDVSPQNVLIGPEGLARVVDFGVAKAASRLHDSANADGRGKLGYTAPERLGDAPVCDARADVFSVGVMAWEILAGRRLFTGLDEVSLLADVLTGPIPELSTIRDDVSPELSAVIHRGLSRNLDERHATAEELAREIDRATPLASARAVGDWVMGLAREAIEIRAQAARDMESGRPKRPGSAGDALSVGALVEEIEAKSGERSRTASERPPESRDGFPSQMPTKVERPQPLPVPPPPVVVDDPVEVPGLSTSGPRRLAPWIGLVAVAALAVVALLAFGGSSTSAPTPPSSSVAPAVPPVAAATSLPSSIRAADAPALPTAEPGAPASAEPAPAPPAGSANPASPGSATAPGTARPPSARPVSPKTPGKTPGYIPDRP
jgi:serine/threonine protein kinase